MAQTQLTHDLLRAESMLMQGDAKEACNFLTNLAKECEEYIDKTYKTTSEVQFFSFPTMFDLLSYKKVETDPRKIIVVDEPFDRMYADYAMALLLNDDYALAQEALKQAVRWNPMECEYRLRLADLFMTNGNVDEYLALTYSVFERASDVEHIVRAFVNFAGHYVRTGREAVAAACLKAAQKLDFKEPHLEVAIDEAKGTAHDPELLDFEEARDILGTEGLPEAANAEIAICLLMCATDAAELGDKYSATNYTMKARNLVGSAACSALLELIHSANEAVGDLSE